MPERPLFVMPGLVPGISLGAVAMAEMDARNKSGHDGRRVGRRASILQTEFALYFFQRVGPRPPGPVVDQPLPGQIQVFQIVEMHQYRFAGVESLGPARRPGEPLKTAGNLIASMSPSQRSAVIA